jgi:hypothetical protein
MSDSYDGSWVYWSVPMEYFEIRLVTFEPYFIWSEPHKYKYVIQASHASSLSMVFHPFGVIVFLPHHGIVVIHQLEKKDILSDLHGDQ